MRMATLFILSFLLANWVPKKEENVMVGTFKS